MFSSITIILGTILLLLLVLKFIDNRNKQHNKTPKISFPVQCIIVVVVCIFVAFAAIRIDSIMGYNEIGYETVVIQINTAENAEDAEKAYKDACTWLERTNSVFDGVTSEQRQSMIDWVTEYEKVN